MLISTGLIYLFGLSTAGILEFAVMSSRRWMSVAPGACTILVFAHTKNVGTHFPPCFVCDCCFAAAAAASRSTWRALKRAEAKMD